ncbi:unnamed protein product [Discosporangium mesarthrocarpum]
MYDGTNYEGFQLQPGRPTVQGVLETRLAQRYQLNVPVVASGRTDAGVHSKGLAVHFDLPNPNENLDELMYKVNRMLPEDVRIWNASHAPPPEPFQREQGLPWNAMTNARSKVYSYRLFFGDILSPMERLYRVQAQRAALSREVDRDLLLRSLPEFVGRHDFAGFANKKEKKAREKLASGKGEYCTVREVYAIQAVDEGGGNLRLDFHLSGALYRMVRNMVGTMLAISSGRVGPEAVQEILATGTRDANKIYSAPAHGLTLENVLYDGYGYMEDDLFTRCRKGGQ